MLRIGVAAIFEAVPKVASDTLAGFPVLESSSTLDLIAYIRALPNGSKVKIYCSMTTADLRCLMVGALALIISC